jgi:hypothetical protein
MKKLTAFLIALTLLAGCETVPHGAPPDPRPEAAWEKQLKALNCSYHRDTLAVRSSEPLVFAIMGYCGGGGLPGKKPGLGYLVLLSVDTGRDEVQAARLASDTASGLHYTASGDLMWFSSAAPDVPSGSQQFIEVFTAPAGSVQERSLGRLETPFFATRPLFSRGEGCHILMTGGAGGASPAPYQRRVWLMRDGDPIGSAKAVEGIGRVLYWSSVQKHFVVQEAKLEKQLKRSRLSCSGERSPVSGDEAVRLGEVLHMNASFMPLPNGDLIVRNESPEPGLDEASLFIFREGRAVEMIGPPEGDNPSCPDLVCEPLYLSATLLGPSPSGRHLLALAVAAEGFIVYRVDDLRAVRRWMTREPFDRYVTLLVDDTTVMQLQDRGAVAYYSW